MPRIDRALIIKSPHIEKILSGTKTWEIRGSRTKVRGPIGLIRGGSGQVVGTCELVDVVGPLSPEEFKKNARKVGMKPTEATELPNGAHTFAWVLKNVRPLSRPRPYKHPSGAVRWVRLTGPRS